MSALGLALIVLGVLQASNWGWLRPLASPIEPFGFSLTPFVIAAGAVVLAGFRSWERRRERRGEEPLVHFRLFEKPMLRGGLTMLLAQNLILMGIFFTIPLFLQIVQGLDALETGVRMLPASVGLFVSALAGSALARRFPPRLIVRGGLAIVFVSTLLLLDTIDADARLDLVPDRDGRARHRDGPRRLAARQRRPVRGRRRRSQRGGRLAEHRRSARLLARHRVARRGRHQRARLRLLRERGRQPADPRRRQGAGRGPALRGRRRSSPPIKSGRPRPMPASIRRRRM